MKASPAVKNKVLMADRFNIPHLKSKVFYRPKGADKNGSEIIKT